MTTLEFLQSGHRLRELIKSYQEELEQLRRLRTSISGSDFSATGGGGGSAERDAKYVRVIVRIDALEGEIEMEMLLYADVLEAIRESINALSDRDEQLVLRDRYILGLKWERIAKRRHISERSARRIHDRAIDKIHIPEDSAQKVGR